MIMKRIQLNKAHWHNVLSLEVIGIFIWIAMATVPIGTNQQKRLLPDGCWEIARRLSDGNQRVFSG